MPNHKVRAWIMSFPGLIEGTDANDALQNAFKASGLKGDMNFETFAKMLDIYGYRPRFHTDTCYRLCLPERGPSVTGVKM